MLLLPALKGSQTCSIFCRGVIKHILGLLFELLVCELVLKLFVVGDKICEHLTGLQARNAADHCLSVSIHIFSYMNFYDHQAKTVTINLKARN